MDTEPQEQEHVEVQETHEADESYDDSSYEQESDESPEVEEKQVPLRAVQKERKKRQEAEALSRQREFEINFMKEQMQKNAAPQEEDESKYESATKAEVRDANSQTRFETKREFREEMWEESFPERKEYVDENLLNFLKQRPHLKTAIEQSPNRYKEAYELMKALSPKQQERMSEQPKKRAPSIGSPNSVPKSAGVNQAVDIMSLADKEFLEWRKGQSKRR